MPEVDLKEEGVRLVRGDRRLKGKIGHLKRPFRKEKGYEVYDQD